MTISGHKNPTTTKNQQRNYELYYAVRNLFLFSPRLIVDAIASD